MVPAIVVVVEGIVEEGVEYQWYKPILLLWVDIIIILIIRLVMAVVVVHRRCQVVIG